jgi:hypothetical protein
LAAIVRSIPYAFPFTYGTDVPVEEAAEEVRKVKIVHCKRSVLENRRRNQRKIFLEECASRLIRKRALKNLRDRHLMSGSSDIFILV